MKTIIQTAALMSLLTGFANANGPATNRSAGALAEYLALTSSTGIRTELIESPWYLVEESNMKNLWGLTGSSQKKAQKLVLQEMRSKLKMEEKDLIESDLTFSYIQSCAKMQDYEKSRVIEISERSSSQSQYAVLSDSSIMVAIGSNWSSSSFDYKEKIEKEVYCASNRFYIKASLSLTAATRRTDSKAQSFYVRKHMETTVKGLTQTLQTFLQGLTEIEMSPIANASLLEKLGVNSAREIPSWMAYHIGVLRNALKYSQLVKSLDLGFDSQSIASPLADFTNQILLKIQQFEEPGIFVVAFGGNLNTQPIQVLDSRQLKELFLLNKEDSPLKPVFRIKNYSYLANLEFLKSAQTEESCDREFSIIKNVNFDLIYKGSVSFLGRVENLKKRCPQKFSTAHTALNSFYSTSYKAEDLASVARKAAEGLKTSDCFIYKTIRVSPDQTNYYHEIGYYICRLP